MRQEFCMTTKKNDRASFVLTATVGVSSKTNNLLSRTFRSFLSVFAILALFFPWNEGDCNVVTSDRSDPWCISSCEFNITSLESNQLCFSRPTVCQRLRPPRFVKQTAEATAPPGHVGLCVVLTVTRGHELCTLNLRFAAVCGC
jgi:hypothetical protein